MAKHILKISVNTAITLKYVDKNTTKKFRDLNNDIVESWQDNKYSTEERRDLEYRSRQDNLWRGFDEIENYTWEESKKLIKNVIEEEQQKTPGLYLHFSNNKYNVAMGPRY